MSYINTLARYPISDGWAEHRARGSLGGIDFAVGVGTPIPAPTDGTLTNERGDGSGGNIATFAHGDGFRDQYLHLSRFAPEGHYKQGETIGYSGGRPGDQGAGSSTGPHIHWHLINPSGGRVNPLDYVQGGSGGGGTASAVEKSVKGVQQNLANMGLYDGIVDGIVGPKTWRGIQTVLKTNGLYSGPIDGVPGPLTYTGLQKYGQKNGNYAPPGVIDGVVGPLSWAGFYQTLVEDIDADKKARDAAAKAAAEAKAAADKLAADNAAAKAKADAAEAKAKADAEAKAKEENSNKPVSNETTPPNKETKPMPEVKPLTEEANAAAVDALGILIPQAKNRKIAYALYGLAALIISNLSVAVMASGTQAPIWLIVASAVVGNLAVPFTTLAIANASPKK
jgi:peptidoglycan hydrolase-like protein with peptidoglycan-binding domain